VNDQDVGASNGTDGTPVEGPPPPPDFENDPVWKAYREDTGPLRERFEDVQEEIKRGGWSARCPLCRNSNRFFITRDFGIERCPAGHDQEAIASATQPRDPGEDDGAAQPPATVTNGAKKTPPKEPLSVPVEEFFAGCGKTIEYIVERYLPKESLLLIGGAPKHCKTWFAGFIAGEAMNAGHNVLFVEKEGSKETLKERLEPFLRPGAKGSLFVSHRKPFMLDNPNSVLWLIAEVKLRKAAVLVLDPLHYFHSHSRQPGDVPFEVISAIQQIISATGCAVVVLHHTRKPPTSSGRTPKNGAEEPGSASSDIVGSYAWAAAADNIVIVTKVKPEDRRPGEVRFFVTNTDTRNGEELPRQLVVVKPGPHGAEDSITFDDALSGVEEALEKLLQRIPVKPDAAMMPAEVITVDDLRKLSGLRKLVVTAAVKLGESQGRILRKSGKNGGVYRPEDRGPTVSGFSSRSGTAGPSKPFQTDFPSENDGPDRHGP